MTLVLANNSTFLSLQKTKHQHGHVHSVWQISGCVPLRLVVITKSGQLRASSDVQQFYSRWQDERWQIVLQTCSIPQGTFTISTISVWSDDELREVFLEKLKQHFTLVHFHCLTNIFTAVMRKLASDKASRPLLITSSQAFVSSNSQRW